MIALGAHWSGDNPAAAHVLLDVVYDIAAGIAPTALCKACGATWDATHGRHCAWCATKARANADYLLRPPAPCGYGYATADDLEHLGYDPDRDRQRQLARWAQDMEMAVEAGILTDNEVRAAWASQ